MKKNTLIIASIVILLIAAGIGLYLYSQTFHAVSIVFKQDNISAKLYKSIGDTDSDDDKGPELKILTKSESISLQDGEYFLVAEGETIATTPIGFTVQGKDTTVEVDPSYSQSYLKRQLEGQVATIHALIKQKYPTIIADYTIQEGQLYQKGDWYGTVLTKNISDQRDVADFYRVVLHKNSTTWEVIDSPVLVLTSSEFKNVPIDVLKSINTLVP